MMNSYKLIYEDKQIIIQTLNLEKSIYLFIGDTSMNFENLIISIKNQSNESLVRPVYENTFSEYGINLAKNLNLKYSLPFYLSFNIDDDQLAINPKFQLILEKNIHDIIKQTIDSDYNK